MGSARIVVVDYGMGNLGSIRNMFSHLGITAVISSDPAAVRTADKLVLSGVGAFDHGMKHLEERGLIPVLRERALGQGIPLLGICLGMQLLTRCSEEGERPGLGWVEAATVRFRFEDEQQQARLKIPHMGWNRVFCRQDSVLFRDMHPEPRFYFVHSYHVVCEDTADVLCTTHHGCDFTAALERGNLYGVQFHPEKSHKYGMKLLANFAELT